MKKTNEERLVAAIDSIETSLNKFGLKTRTVHGRNNIKMVAFHLEIHDWKADRFPGLIRWLTTINFTAKQRDKKTWWILSPTPLQIQHGVLEGCLSLETIKPSTLDLKELEVLAWSLQAL